MGEREFARSMVDAFNRADVEALETLTHTECELRGLRYEVDGTSYHGVDGVRGFWDDASEVWEEMRMEDAQIFDRPGRALILCRFVLRGRGSGAVVEHDMAVLTELRDGLMIKGHTTLDVEQAKRDFEAA